MSAAVLDHSFSSSAMHQLHIGAAPSGADGLPSIKFGFEDLRDRMARFTVRFDDFIRKGRERVLEERNQFHLNIKELKDDQEMKSRDIEILSLESATHSKTIAKESQETAEMHTAISSLTTQRDSLMAARDSLKSQISEIQKQIAARREAQQKHRRYLEGQARFNEPELEFWEGYLCLRIEGAGTEDRLKFIYAGVSERDWDLEAWFELDTSAREYKVAEYRPKVERDAVERVLERLNENRDLAGFLKSMRELFVEALK